MSFIFVAKVSLAIVSCHFLLQISEILASSSCNAKSVPIIITTICAGREIYPHTNVRDPGKQARGQSQPVHQSQLQPLVDFCSETNVVGRWGQEEEEGARTKTDCWRRHPRLAKCKWQKPCQIHLSDNLCSALNDSTFVLWAANIHSAKETLIKKSDLLDLPLKRGINPQAESFCHRFWAQGWSRNWNYIFVFISIFVHFLIFSRTLMDGSFGGVNRVKMLLRDLLRSNGSVMTERRSATENREFYQWLPPQPLDLHSHHCC